MTAPIHEHQARLVARATPDGAFERPLTAVERDLHGVAMQPTLAGAKGVALLRLGIALDGPEDVDLLVRTLDELPSRHDVMRTSHPERGGEPYALVHATVPSLLAVLDAAADTAADAAYERESANPSISSAARCTASSCSDYLRSASAGITSAITSRATAAHRPRSVGQGREPPSLVEPISVQ